jgi:hypothetical protein
MPTLKGLRARLHNIKEKSEAFLDDALLLIEVWGGAFASGFANEKWGTNGELEVMGVPADLLLGVAGGGLSLAGAFGKHHSHALNVSAGIGSGWFYRLGANLAGGPENPQFGPFPWQSQQTQGWGGPGHQRGVHVTSGNEMA